MSDISIQLEKAARAGGKVLSSYFGQVLETERKSIASDFRTKADLEAEEVIIKELNKVSVKANIHSEERGFIDNKSEFTFVVDPLDGTNNFVLGIPYVSVAIALVKKGETVAAVVFNPILDQLYSAEKGKGAFLNGKKINISNERLITNATVSLICAYKTPRSFSLELDQKLSSIPVKRILPLWAPALDFCLLANGKTESIIVNSPGEMYEVTSGKLIAKEAGAILTDFEGNTETDDANAVFIMSCTKEIHDKILAAV